MWFLPDVAKAAGVWHFDGGLKAESGPGRFKPPWLVDMENPDSDLERWIYDGIGTATYFMNEKPGRPAHQDPAAGGDGAGGGELAPAPAPKPSGVELVLWSEQDEAGTCLGGLTDRSRSICPPPPAFPRLMPPPLPLPRPIPPTFLGGGVGGSGGVHVWRDRVGVGRAEEESWGGREGGRAGGREGPMECARRTA